MWESIKTNSHVAGRVAVPLTFTFYDKKCGNANGTLLYYKGNATNL